MAHDHRLHVEPRTQRVLAAVALALAALTVLGMVVLRPTGRDRPDLALLGAATELHDARVVAVERRACAGTTAADGVTCSDVELELLSGPDDGGATRLELPDAPSTPQLDVGDEVVLSYAPEAGPGFEYQFADRQRRPVLTWLAVLFAGAVVVLGRLRGLAALAGLAASVAVLLTFALPAIIDGRSPVWVALVAASAISFLALYLAHGFGAMTTVALLGTLASLALTGLLAEVFVRLAELSGFASEEALFLQAAGAELDVRGLVLAGVVIGALGALDDMTVTQASAVSELRAADPAMPRSRLMSAGLRIGRDHVASTVNTLFLAYAGASMPLLVLFVLTGQPLGAVANGELVATEIIRTLVGSIGLVASVPLTTWLAAVVSGAPRVRPGTDPARP